jgi:valyl-tRNA synthetase
MVESWPDRQDEEVDPKAADTLALMQELISGIRNVKNEYGVSPGKEISAILNLPEESNGLISTMEANKHYFSRLARVNDLQVGSKQPKPKASASVVVGAHEVYIPLAGMIDLAIERERLQKEITQKDQYLHTIQRKLQNENFVTRAPAEVVEAEREKARQTEVEVSRLKANLMDLE